MNSDLYVAWVCAPVGPLFSIGLETEDPTSLARLDDKTHQAQDILASWILTARGKVLAALVMQGAFQVPADQVHDLGRIIDEIQAYVSMDYHFGIGIDLREAYYALMAAQRGQEPYRFFTEECLKVIEEADKGQPLEARLGPSDDLDTDHGQLPEGRLHKGEDPEAPMEVGGDPQGGEIQPDQAAQTRALIVESLQRIKEHAPALEALATTNPAALAAVHGVVQAMVQMAHWLRDGTGSPEDVEKSEALMKKLGLPAPKKLKTQVKAHMEYPATPGPSARSGTIKDGKIKGTSTEGKTKWHQSTSGSVMGPTGVAVSSREPNAK